MESPPVFPVQQTASATLQRQHCARRSIHRACCDRARDGRPHLALRSPPCVQAPRVFGFQHGGSRRGVRRSKSPACPALPEHCCHSTKSACNRIPALELPESTRESCNLHLAVATGRFLYCHRIVLLHLLPFLVGTEEPPSAATRQATNGWRLQHIIYTAQGEVACAEGGEYVDSVWALRWGWSTGALGGKVRVTIQAGSRGLVNGHAYGWVWSGRRSVGEGRKKIPPSRTFQYGPTPYACRLASCTQGWLPSIPNPGHAQAPGDEWDE